MCKLNKPLSSWASFNHSVYHKNRKQTRSGLVSVYMGSWALVSTVLMTVFWIPPPLVFSLLMDGNKCSHSHHRAMWYSGNLGPTRNKIGQEACSDEVGISSGMKRSILLPISTWLLPGLGSG